METRKSPKEHESLRTDTAGDSGSSVSGAVVRGTQWAQRAVFAPGAIAAGLTAAAVLSAVVLRWFNLGKQSLDFDEGFTAWASGLSPVNIVRFARSDPSPPLYYL